MSFFATKTLLAVLFVAAGLTAVGSMLTLMGRTERRMSVPALKATHKIAGYTFAVLLVLLAIMGLRYLSSAGDSLSVRGVLHWSIASLLVFVVALKLVVVRWFKQFLKFVPVMGMIVITLALVVAMLSAVFFVVTGGRGGEQRGPARVEIPATQDDAEPVNESVSERSADEEDAYAASRTDEPTAVVPGSGEEASANAEQGGQVFGKYCSGCHYDDSADRKIGPGLAGMFGRDTIAASGKPPSRANVREQIVAPAGGMPSFEPYLSDEQLDDLIAYLETL